MRITGAVGLVRRPDKYLYAELPRLHLLLREQRPFLLDWVPSGHASASPQRGQNDAKTVMGRLRLLCVSVRRVGMNMRSLHLPSGVRAVRVSIAVFFSASALFAFLMQSHTFRNLCFGQRLGALVDLRRGPFRRLVQHQLGSLPEFALCAIALDEQLTSVTQRDGLHVDDR